MSTLVDLVAYSADVVKYLCLLKRICADHKNGESVYDICFAFRFANRKLFRLHQLLLLRISVHCLSSTPVAYNEQRRLRTADPEIPH